MARASASWPPPVGEGGSVGPGGRALAVAHLVRRVLARQRPVRIEKTTEVHSRPIYCPPRGVAQRDSCRGSGDREGGGGGAAAGAEGGTAPRFRQVREPPARRLVQTARRLPQHPLEPRGRAAVRRRRL